MRAGLRFKIDIGGGGACVRPASALAQRTPEPPPTTNTPATDAVGPPRAAEFQPARHHDAPGRPAGASARRPPGRADAARCHGACDRGHRRSPAPRGASTGEPGRTGTDSRLRTACDSRHRPSPTSPSPVSADATERCRRRRSFACRLRQPLLHRRHRRPLGARPERGISFLPWLLAAFALGGRRRVPVWRRRPREASPAVRRSTLSSRRSRPPRARADAARRRLRPQPVAAAAAKPAAAASAGSSPRGCGRRSRSGCSRCAASSTTTRSRSSSSSSCSTPGRAPARAVLAEASLFNAGATQDQELGRFFANPVGAGERIDAIPPLKRMTLTQPGRRAARGRSRNIELGGRKVVRAR